jgi:hypothetical protein
MPTTLDATPYEKNFQLIGVRVSAATQNARDSAAEQFLHSGCAAVAEQRYLVIIDRYEVQQYCVSPSARYCVYPDPATDPASGVESHPHQKGASIIRKQGGLEGRMEGVTGTGPGSLGLDRPPRANCLRLRVRAAILGANMRQGPAGQCASFSCTRILIHADSSAGRIQTSWSHQAPTHAARDSHDRWSAVRQTHARSE